MTTTSRLSTAPSAPPIHAMRREFRDFDEFAHAIEGWGLDWLQLDRGSLEAKLQQIATPNALLTRFYFSRKFHQRGTSPPGVRTFGFTGEQSPNIEWRGNTGTDCHIVAFPANDHFEMVSHPRFHGDTVSIPEDRIRSVALFLGLPDPLLSLSEGFAFLEIDPRRLATLRNTINRPHSTARMLGDLQPSDTDFNEMDFDIAAALISALSTNQNSVFSPRDSALRARSIRLALDFIEDHADEPPSIQDICRVSGVSWRTLNYAFHEKFGITPKQYLQATRLQRVRERILRSDPSSAIAEIAAHWGFWHMGQFARDYRKQFGELPSETLFRTSQ